jgi:hypothetical protein
MTKSKQLADELNRLRFNHPTFNDSFIAKEIRIRLEEAFNDGVEQTIIANNKKTFIKPTYNDNEKEN